MPCGSQRCVLHHSEAWLSTPQQNNKERYSKESMQCPPINSHSCFKYILCTRTSADTWYTMLHLLQQGLSNRARLLLYRGRNRWIDVFVVLLRPSVLILQTSKLPVNPPAKCTPQNYADWRNLLASPTRHQNKTHLTLLPYQPPPQRLDQQINERSPAAIRTAMLLATGGKAYKANPLADFVRNHRGAAATCGIDGDGLTLCITQCEGRSGVLGRKPHPGACRALCTVAVNPCQAMGANAWVSTLATLRIPYSLHAAVVVRVFSYQLLARRYRIVVLISMMVGIPTESASAGVVVRNFFRLRQWCIVMLLSPILCSVEPKREDTFIAKFFSERSTLGSRQGPNVP